MIRPWLGPSCTRRMEDFPHPSSEAGRAAKLHFVRDLPQEVEVEDVKTILSIAFMPDVPEKQKIELAIIAVTICSDFNCSRNHCCDNQSC